MLSQHTSLHYRLMKLLIITNMHEHKQAYIAPTFHSIFHILCEHIPHDFRAYLSHIQLLRKPVREHEGLK